MIPPVQDLTREGPGTQSGVPATLLLEFLPTWCPPTHPSPRISPLRQPGAQGLGGREGVCLDPLNWSPNMKPPSQVHPSSDAGRSREHGAAFSQGSNVIYDFVTVPTSSLRISSCSFSTSGCHSNFRRECVNPYGVD